MKQQQKRELVAIIGMACRFPGANNYGQFWKNMEAGVNSISEIPPKGGKQKSIMLLFLINKIRR